MNRKTRHITTKSRWKHLLQTVTVGFLSFVLLTSVGVNTLARETPVPVAANTSSSSEETVNERLATVTRLVKKTLDVGDEYTQFSGSLLDKSIRELWTLNWSSDGERLSVTADSTGKIFRLSRYTDSYDYYYSNDFAPKFPAVTRDQAKKQAEAFLDKVLAANESCELTASDLYEQVIDVDSYYFWGTLKINNLETPISISIRVSTSDKKVSSFSRSDQNTEYLPDIPSATPVTTEKEAFNLLSSTVKMKLEYVPLFYNSDYKIVKAGLRYLPISTGDYIVNAKTGELINLTELHDDIMRDIAEYDTSKMMTGSDSAAPQAAGGSLTEVELEGISKLEGVLERDELDKAARSITEFGLDEDYTLNQINYYTNESTEQITANLSYYKKAPRAEGEYVRYFYKYLNMDAKTGEVLSLSTSYPGDEDYSSIERDRNALQQKAEAFLQKYFEEYYKETDVYNRADPVDIYSVVYRNIYNPSESYTFAQKVNGYFFPSNALYISVNAKTGTIDSFNKNWTDNIEFGPAEGIITNEAACAAYSNAFDTRLSYVGVPVKVDPSRPELIPYAEYGYSFVYQLTLSYTSFAEDYVLGVDALTGEPVVSKAQATEPYTYDDISGHYAEKQIMKLAEHGIGYFGKSFLPSKKLTQLDMILLFLSADGYRLQVDADNMTDEAIDQLYNTAYYRNIISKDQKDPKKLMTRADVIRTILKMSGYDKTANLKGIYVVNFKDSSSIRDADYGYFAIAQGLGIIRGDGNGNVNPYATSTRVEAALMLYNFMSR